MKQEILQKGENILKNLQELLQGSQITQEQYNFVAERIEKLGSLVNQAEESSLPNLSRILDSLVTTLQALMQSDNNL